MSKVDLNLSACDREPIHVPGSIQPHGMLLVADAGTLDVVAAAGAIEDRLRLTSGWLGRPLAELLAQDVRGQLEASSAQDAPLILDETVEGVGECFRAVCHRAGERLLVELEPAAERSRGTMQVLEELDRIVRGFEQASTTAVLCERAAAVFRRLTGFDRVMIYQFVDDEAGRAVAEDRDPALHGFLNHHFLASDIPRQARALYVRNRARAIPDIDYIPAPIRPAGFGQLDLSDVALRSVSPIHLQYLRNMGVKASASFSIVCDGVLWGLVACHHNSPRRLPRETAMSGTPLANALARQTRAKVQTAIYDERLRLRVAVDELVDQISEDHGAARAFDDIADPLRRILRADGLAFLANGVARLYGMGPDDAALT